MKQGVQASLGRDPAQEKLQHSTVPTSLLSLTVSKSKNVGCSGISLLIKRQINRNNGLNKVGERQQIKSLWVFTKKTPKRQKKRNPSFLITFSNTQALPLDFSEYCDSLFFKHHHQWWKEIKGVPTEEKAQNPEITRRQYTHKTLNCLPNANKQF